MSIRARAAPAMARRRLPMTNAGELLSPTLFSEWLEHAERRIER